LGRGYLSTLSASDGRLTDEVERRQDGLIEVLSPHFSEGTEENKKTHSGKLFQQPNRFL
jgi:hypothetical protein